MAKDDYDVIVFRILTYLYGCMKRKVIFNKDVFNTKIRKDIADEYFADIIFMMNTEELIEGVVLTTAWGKTKLLISDESEMQITAKGIRYLKENSTMQRVKDILLSQAGGIAELIQIVL